MRTDLDPFLHKVSKPRTKKKYPPKGTRVLITGVHSNILLGRPEKMDETATASGASTPYTTLNKALDASTLGELLRQNFGQTSAKATFDSRDPQLAKLKVEKQHATNDPVQMEIGRARQGDPSARRLFHNSDRGDSV